MTDEICDLLLTFVAKVRDSDVVPSSGGWSDRTLLVKGTSVLRAAATLDNQTDLKPRHLLALSHIFPFRVDSTQDLEKVKALLLDVVREATSDDDDSDSDDDEGLFSFGRKRSDLALGRVVSTKEIEETKDASTWTYAKMKQKQKERGKHNASLEVLLLRRVGAVFGAFIAAMVALKQVALPPEQRAYELDERATQTAERLVRKVTAGMLKSSKKDHNKRKQTPWSAPRFLRPAESLSDALDPVSLALWFKLGGEVMPRAWSGYESGRGKVGRVVVLKDSSSSMAGPKSTWTSKVALGLVDACKKSKKQVMVLDFSDKEDFSLPTTLFMEKDSFFRYDSAFAKAADSDCGGLTNFNAGLQRALDALLLNKTRSDTDHVVLLTDGLPTEGSNAGLDFELQRAKDNNVRVHPIFLGRTYELPTELANMALCTNGRLFHARPSLLPFWENSDDNDDDDTSLLVGASAVNVDLLDATPSLRRAARTRRQPSSSKVASR